MTAQLGTLAFDNSSVKQILVEKYNYVFNELCDPRSKQWFLISSPIPLFTIICVYLFLIYVALPLYMKKRNPYNLKNVIISYNLYQIIACIGLVYWTATPISEPAYDLICRPMDYSTTKRSLKMLNICYCVFLLKVSEMCETIFFVLRKKYNQVSPLHIYHHVAVVITAWIFTKYLPGGMTTFVFMTNSFIHIVMYIYYLMTTFGSHWQKKVAKWKSALTMLQMVQFCVLIGHGLQGFLPECGIPKTLVCIHIPNVAILLHMFKRFYTDNYAKHRKQKIY